MKNTERIINFTKREMKDMLSSVLEYNKIFLKKKQGKLLERILFAISVIDRKYFYPGREAYIDTALPIGEGQTISQPSTVARMLLLAGLSEGEDVLEIGTGSGWNASLIAFLVYPGSVVSIERINSLKEKAEKNLAELKSYLKQKKPEVYEKIEKITFFAENIFKKGRAWKKNYDKIIITAGIETGEENKIEILAKNLLKQKGLLICPYTSGPILIYQKIGKKLEKQKTREQYVFVPLLE